MANKSAATSSCEEMVIQIAMPDETVEIERMNLSVSRDEIDLQTPHYRLRLPLAQPIDPDKGRAIWDKQTKRFTLRLRMDREFDFVNF